MLRAARSGRSIYADAQASAYFSISRNFHKSNYSHKHEKGRSKFSSKLNDIFDPERKRSSKQTQSKRTTSEAALLTMKFIKEKPAKFLGKYVDPTSKLNLTLPSKEIVSEIQKSFEERFNQRYKTPSRGWKENATPETETKEIRKKLSQSIANAKVNGQSLLEPPQTGDIVTLFEDLRLYIVAEGPKSIKFGSLTFINARGEIVFGKNVQIHSRIPGVIPKEYHGYLRNFVCLEEKIKGVAPVGMADNFSVSKGQINQEKGNDLLEPEINDPSDFVVAQATSQLLVDTDINTYVVPDLARSTFSEPLSKLGIDTFKKLGIINSKLEKLHRTLQYDHAGNLNVPRTISLFEILHHLEYDPEISPESKQGGDSRLGTSLEFIHDLEDYDYSASTYLATLFVLSKQSRLWNLEYTQRNECPTRVVILPVSDISYIGTVMFYLQHEDGINQFSKYCADKLSGSQPDNPPALYNDIIGMLKDFVNRKFDHDPAVETVLVYILRAIERFLPDSSSDFSSLNYSNDYSRTRAYDLLMNLEKSGSIINPFKWSKTSSWPNEKTSYLTDLSQIYYECVGKNATIPSKVPTAMKLDQLDQQPLVNLNEDIVNAPDVGFSEDFYDSDPMMQIREDLTKVPVYCVDSEFAHEIDDGISIHEEDGKYVISVHVAEPSSYVKPDSILSSIAFDRTATKYFPETALLLFPGIISDLAGLGINTKETRSFTIQYKLNMDSVDGFFKQRLDNPESDINSNLLKNIMSQIENTKEVKYCLLKNFRTGFTYEKVTKLLRSGNRTESFNSNPDYNNLFKLFQISNILKEIREENMPFKPRQNISHVRVISNKKEIPSVSNFIENSLGYEMRLKNSDQSIIPSTDVDNDEAVSMITQCMVFANYLVGSVAKEKNINIIYRTFDFALADNLRKQFEELTKTSTFKGEFDFYSFSRPARYSATYGKHALIGLDTYSNITSPMRRYVDIINQWKFQDYFLGRQESYIKDENLHNIVNTINSKATYARRPAASAENFWNGIFLREYNTLFQAGKIETPIIFSLVLKAAPRKDTVVSVTCENFPHLKSTLEISSQFMEDYENELIGRDGRICSNRLQISRIDYVEDDLLFKYV
ncbi:Exoribonuclease II mitochondrial [Spathaspora sp. JA1]|nr:Exoribonuclease II mitochondrial [Spathaspora sp. JA1]